MTPGLISKMQKQRSRNLICLIVRNGTNSSIRSQVQSLKCLSFDFRQTLADLVNVRRRHVLILLLKKCNLQCSVKNPNADRDYHLVVDGFRSREPLVVDSALRKTTSVITRAWKVLCHIFALYFHFRLYFDVIFLIFGYILALTYGIPLSHSSWRHTAREVFDVLLEFKHMWWGIVDRDQGFWFHLIGRFRETPCCP